MSYVDDNLMAGEQVIHRARLHWGIFVGPAILLFIGFVFGISLLASIGGGGGVLAFLIVLILCSIWLIRRTIKYLTTEFAITSRRVIVKHGFIKRHTLELNHSRVESLSVNQGVIARIFNAGTIVVRGMGGTPQGIPFVSAPMDFRRNALETIDASEDR